MTNGILEQTFPKDYALPVPDASAVGTLRQREEETAIARDIRLLFATLPDCDPDEEGVISPVAQEDGFTLSFAQFSAGLRLAVSDRDGLILACPHCGKRCLVSVPYNKNSQRIDRGIERDDTENIVEITVCAEGLGSNPNCDYYKLPAGVKIGKNIGPKKAKKAK